MSAEELSYLDDPFLEAIEKFPGGVISGMSALKLYNLTDARAEQVELTFPQGHHAPKTKLIRMKHLKAEYFDIGRAEVETPDGNMVPAYTPERAIVDIWRDSHVGENWKYQALRNYIDGGFGQFQNIIRVAHKLPGTKPLIYVIGAIRNYDYTK
jgi:predicted transcriptional regulator of viral defense system